MAFGFLLQQGFMKKEVGAAGGRSVTKTSIVFIDAVLNGIFDGPFDLGGESRYFPVWAVDHVSGENHDTGELKYLL